MQLFFENSQRSLRTREGNKYNSLFPAGADSTAWPFESGRIEPLNPSDDSSVFLQPLPAREEVLRFLLQSSESDAAWVLDGVLSDRPELLQQQLEKKGPKMPVQAELQADKSEALRVATGVAHGTSEQESLKTLGNVRRAARENRGRQSVHDYLAQMRVHSSLTQEVALEICRVRKTEAEQELNRRRILVTHPLVQFSSFMYYFNEDDCVTNLEVVRIGNCQNRSAVQYETLDATGMANHKFMHTTGTLVFEPGEEKKWIMVELVDDELWGTTTEFHVKLKSEGLVGAVLGKYLWHTRVIIDDDETFPTNRFKQEILDDKIEEIPKFTLLIEYCKMNFASKPGIRQGTIKLLLVEQVHNLALAFRMLLSIYLVDFVLKQDRSEDSLFFHWGRIAWLAAISSSFVVQCAVLHVIDYRKLGWRLPGLSRHTLQTAVLTKFLNYDETARTQFRFGDLVLAVTRDSERLVNMGYMGLLSLSKNIGQFVILVSLRIILSIVTDHKIVLQKFIGVLMVFSVPFFKVPFLAWRRKLNTTILDNQHRRQNELAHQIDQTVTNYRLIADYNRRPYFIDKFNNKIKEYNNTALMANEAGLNNHYFGTWVTAVLVGTYTFMGGINVLEDTLTLGTFLADIHIFQQIGAAFSKIFHIFLDMQLVMPDLVRMVNLLNLPIDVPQKMKLHRLNEDFSKQLLAAIDRADGAVVQRDCLPIIVENIEFKFNAKMVKDVIDAPRLGSMRGRINITQGQHVSFVGPRGEGKSTLMKIIGGVNLAIVNGIGAHFYIPAHLRVLHVSTEPMFFHGTLLENITFGVFDGDADANIDRVLAICERVGLPPFVRKLMLKEETHAWEDLSQTQKHLLNISRALICNPEVMCIQKPVQVFDKVHARKILSLLKEFVINRGIEQGTTQEHYRRPRTCISTSSTMLGVELADIVYHISHAGGIQEILKDGVSTDMLG